MVPVAAARFHLDECNNAAEREFIQFLHARAEAGKWYADAWPREDRIVISVCVFDMKEQCVLRTLRIDFDGRRTTFGPDETHQFVTDLDPQKPGVTVLNGIPLQEAASAAADWIEREVARPIAVHAWIRPEGAARVHVLADTGEGLICWSNRPNGSIPLSELGPPDRIIPVVTS